ncbi:hypothetical protein M514_27832 [Trichuris suis]|uniref:Uncharacterized protein n=1 Tax=Trichuris suis TaxID=68888 RepID=A0A085MRY8_9BILA|nr:hypothetical protein M514_27832 [Trichuris suis]
MGRGSVAVAKAVSCGSQMTLLVKQSEARRSARPFVVRTAVVNDRSVYLQPPGRQRRCAVPTAGRQHHASKRCARPPVASRPLAEQQNSKSDEDDEGAVVPRSSRSNKTGSVAALRRAASDCRRALLLRGYHNDRRRCRRATLDHR